MGNTKRIGDFTVTKTNPSGNTVKFAITDSANLLTTSKDIKAVLNDAIQQWIDAERADLDNNGDTDVLGATDYHPGDGFAAFSYNVEGKYATVDLTALTGISVSGTLTAAAPFADVA